MFSIKKWVNRQSEHPARRRLTPTGNDNEYDVARAEGIIMDDGDAFDADTMNDLENRIKEGFEEYDPNGNGVDVAVQVYTCTKSNSVYALTGSGAVGRCKIPAAWASGDTWTVNGTAVPAYCGADTVDGDTIVAGRWVLFTFDGTQLNFNGGGGLSSSKLAQATAAASHVLAGDTFYAGGKNLQVGTMRNNGNWPDADKLTLEGSKIYMYKADGYTGGGLGTAASLLGNAIAGHLLAGVSASSSNGLNFPGSMPNRGAWGATIAPGGYASIPYGYHNGGGGVTAAKAGISLVHAKTDFGGSVSLNYSETFSGANALLIIILGDGANGADAIDQINTPSVSSGSISGPTVLQEHLYREGNPWFKVGKAFTVNNISGDCTVGFSTTTWNWGWAVFVFKIA